MQCVKVQMSGGRLQGSEHEWNQGTPRMTSERVDCGTEVARQESDAVLGVSEGRALPTCVHTGVKHGQKHACISARMSVRACVHVLACT